MPARKPNQPLVSPEQARMILNQVMSRSALMRGAIKDARRDIDDECGYPKTAEIECKLYRDLFDREPIAHRVVNVLPHECWKVDPTVFEDDDENVSTDFELAIDELSDSLFGQSWYEGDEGSPIWDFLERADVLSGIGSFGAILLGLDDGRDLSEPADGLDNFGRQTNTPKGRKLIYMRTFDESLIQATQFETDKNNPRYGMPIAYTLTLNDPNYATPQRQGIGIPTTLMNVHWTRVVHVADNLTSSEVFGIPRMQPVLNRLLDLQKLYGGSGEMYWKGAFPGLSIETHPQLGPDIKLPSELRDVIEEYSNSLSRYLAIAGASVKTLSPTVVDPTPQIKTQVEAICIDLEMPMRVFMGSERGELASSQDSDTWDGRVARRQNKIVTPRIIAQFFNRLILLGCLPIPRRFKCKWGDLSSMNDMEQADVATKRITAVSQYIAGQCESLFTPMTFFTEFLGMDEKKATSILESAEENITEKQALGLPAIGQELTSGPKPTGAQPQPGMPGAPGMFGQPGVPGMPGDPNQPPAPGMEGMQEQDPLQAMLQGDGTEAMPDLEDLPPEEEEPTGEVPPQLKKFTKNALPPLPGSPAAGGLAQSEAGAGTANAEQPPEEEPLEGGQPEGEVPEGDMVPEGEFPEEGLDGPLGLDGENTSDDHEAMAGEPLSSDTTLTDADGNPLTDEFGNPIAATPADPMTELLDQVKETTPARGSLLPSSHVPSLEERMAARGTGEAEGGEEFDLDAMEGEAGTGSGMQQPPDVEDPEGDMEGGDEEYDQEGDPEEPAEEGEEPDATTPNLEEEEAGAGTANGPATANVFNQWYNDLPIYQMRVHFDWDQPLRNGVFVDNAKDDGDGSWITLPSGTHVFVKDGEITKGPKALRGSGKGKSSEPRGSKSGSKEERQRKRLGIEKSVHEQTKKDAAKFARPDGTFDRAGYDKHLERQDRKAQALGFKDATDRVLSQGKEKLPKDPTKLTIRQAASHLGRMGYQLGLRGGQYHLVDKEGRSTKVDAQTIKSMLYGGKAAASSGPRAAAGPRSASSNPRAPQGGPRAPQGGKPQGQPKAPAPSAQAPAQAPPKAQAPAKGGEQQSPAPPAPGAKPAAKAAPAAPASKPGLMARTKESLKGAPQYETAIMRAAQRIGALGKIAGSDAKSYLKGAVAKLAKHLAAKISDSRAGKAVRGYAAKGRQLGKAARGVAQDYKGDAKALGHAISKIGKAIKYLTGNEAKVLRLTANQDEWSRVTVLMAEIERLTKDGRD